MKSILSVLMAAALILSALTACGDTKKTNADNGRLETTPAAQATTRPVATAVPNGMGDRVGDAARDAGSAVGNAVEDVGDMAGNAIARTGDAVEDLFDGNDDTRTGAGLEDDRNVTSTAKP